MKPDPILVLFLNLVPGGGWGYLFLRQWAKAIIAIVIYVPVAIITWGPGAVLLSIITAIDAYLQAKQLDAGRTIGQFTFFKQSFIHHRGTESTE